METDFCGPSLPLRFGQSVQTLGSSFRTLRSSVQTLETTSKGVVFWNQETRFGQNIFSQSSFSEEDHSSVPIKKSAKPQKAPDQQDRQDNPDPVFYREVDMSDLPSQYVGEVETFRHILDLPDPRETMPRSSTTVLGLNDEKDQQELRPRGPSAMLPLSPYLKGIFEIFELPGL